MYQAEKFIMRRMNMFSSAERVPTETLLRVVIVTLHRGIFNRFHAFIRFQKHQVRGLPLYYIDNRRKELNLMRRRRLN
jgi:hypothetical protein